MGFFWPAGSSEVICCGQVLADIYWREFWLSFLNALRWQDIVVSGAKILLFGMSLATVAIYYGLKAEERLGSLAIQTTEGASYQPLFYRHNKCYFKFLGICLKFSIKMIRKKYIFKCHSPSNSLTLLK